MSCSAKIAGNGDTQLAFVIFRGPNMSSVMGSIKPFTIVNLHGAVKLMTKLILPD